MRMHEVGAIYRVVLDVVSDYLRQDGLVLDLAARAEVEAVDAGA